MGLTGLKSRCGQGYIPSQGFKGEAASRSFFNFWRGLHPWLVASTVLFKTKHHISPPLLPASHLLL